MDKKVLLFGKEDCALCLGWKKKLEHAQIPYVYYDVETTDGLVEFAFNNMGQIPALLIGQRRFEEVNPGALTTDEIRQYLDE